jgi:hypothetical protein
MNCTDVLFAEAVQSEDKLNEIKRLQAEGKISNGW